MGDEFIGGGSTLAGKRVRERKRDSNKKSKTGFEQQKGGERRSGAVSIAGKKRERHGGERQRGPRKGEEGGRGDRRGEGGRDGRREKIRGRNKAKGKK